MSLADVAAGQLGTTENPPGSNRNPYSEALGRPAEPWCADFVVWCARQAGLVLPSESAYTPAMAAGFQRTGAWTEVPAPGTVVFFDFPDSSTGIQHVGLVEAVNPDGSLTTIEGNTSSGEAGSQDNGGGVFRRRRPLRFVVGFGVPLPIAAQEESHMANQPHTFTFHPTPSGQGYWIVVDTGAVYAFGDAAWHGGIHFDGDQVVADLPQ